MRIALGQIHGTENVDTNRATVTRMAYEAAKSGATLFVLPEMSVLDFFPRIPHRYEYFDRAESIPGPTTEWFQDLARDTRMWIVFNHYERSPAGLYYDTSVVIDDRGDIEGRQRMMHLAEEPGYNEKFYYTPGNDRYNVFKMGEWCFGIAICYDRHFPEVFRAFVLQGAHLVLVPTAVSHSEPFAETYELEMRAAAVTHGVYIAMANRVGPEPPLNFIGRSMVVDPFGRVSKTLGEEENAVLVVDLDIDTVRRARIMYPFLRDRRPETYGIVATHPDGQNPWSED